MMRHLIAQYHPSVREALSCWFNLPAHGSKRGRTEVQRCRIATLKQYPAMAVRAAYGISRLRAEDIGLCRVPSKEYRLRSRLARGVAPTTPAHLLRVQVGRKYITVYKEKSAA